MKKKETSFYDEDTPLLPNLSVFESDEPQKTGLVDLHGRPLVRLREPIGFKLKN